LTRVSALHKLVNAVDRGHFRTLDLFAGCGGMSLGFHRAGFRSVGAVEINDSARLSHAMNFERLAHPDGYRSFADVTHLEPEEAVQHLSAIGRPEERIDVIIGGPPCQAFSRLGRAAIWRLAGRDQAHGEDERATMYHHFMRFVAHLQPVAFVMENVREMGKFVGRNVAEEVAATSDALGYETRYCLLNAVWYGVPQLRERMFIIGIRKELEIAPSYPEIRFDCEIPTGYSTSRSGTGAQQVLVPFDHYVDHAEAAKSLLLGVTAGEAFEDLPRIMGHLDGRKGKGHQRDVDQRFKYNGKNNAFTTEMKNWPDFVSGDDFSGHVIRYTPRDYETFRRMPAGGMYPEALATAREIFRERLEAAERELGRAIQKNTVEWNRIFKETVPPYKENRYPNKFRKMWKDKPARTVPAHIGKDSYSHIHFDSSQARCVSLREAARLQSLPDAFRLSGSMNVQLAQIGNAVPPLLAYAVGQQLATQLKAFALRDTSARAAE
jgi:DNA (cytosine-5)-methyltransferase 1